MLDASSLIIIIGIIVLVYILYLYFKCKRLEKKLHYAAIIISAHKTVLLNKVVLNEKCHKSNLRAKAILKDFGISLSLDDEKATDVHIINRQLDEEIAECCKFMIEHEQELIKNANKDGIVNVDNKEDK